MTYEEFLEFVPSKCMYETIYDDSEGRPILVISLLDAYGMVNKAITALRLAIDVQNMASESTYKAALAQQEPVFFGVKDQGVKVSSLEFVTRVMGKEEVIGKPIFWAEWPSKEPK